MDKKTAEEEIRNWIVQSWVERNAIRIGLAFMLLSVIMIIIAGAKEKKTELKLQAAADQISRLKAQSAIDSTDKYLQALHYQDSLNTKQHEIIELQERNALLANKSFSQSERIWAINEYIRSGRFPSAEEIHRKFSGHPR